MYRGGTNDPALLVRAFNDCRDTHCPDDPPLAITDLEALIREIQLDPAISIVALDGSEPIGVLLAARRTSEALVYRLTVHPAHIRRGHGRGLLTALAERAASAGITRIVAEVPGDLGAPRGLLERCGYSKDFELTDYALDPAAHAPGASGAPPDDSFLVAITLDDILADPSLGGLTARAWERCAPTLSRRKHGIQGLALAALNSIAAFLLYRRLDAGRGTEIVAFRALDTEDGESAAGCLLDSTLRRVPKPLVFPATHPEELDPAWLATWGFRPQRTIHRYVMNLSTGG